MHFRPWMLLVASLAVSFALGEVVCRLALPAPGFVPFVTAEMHGVVQTDPERGYRYASHLARHIVTPNYEIDFATNALGMRDVELDLVPPSSRHWLAVGDSYTQGHGVQVEESWAKQLQRRLVDVHVFNGGVSAYGLHQMRQTANALFPQIRPELILVGIFSSGFTRIEDPYVVVGDGAGLMVRSAAQAPSTRVGPDGFRLAVFASDPQRSMSVWIDRNWQLLGHLLHLVLGPRTSGAAGLPSDDALPPRESLEQAMSPMLGEWAGLASDAERLGVPLVALVIGSVDEAGRIPAIRRLHHEILLDFAREKGLCAIDSLPALERSGLGPGLRLGSDVHWSPAAHAIGGALVFEALEGKGSSAGGACAPAARVARTRS